MNWLAPRLDGLNSAFQLGGLDSAFQSFAVALQSAQRCLCRWNHSTLVSIGMLAMRVAVVQQRPTPGFVQLLVEYLNLSRSGAMHFESWHLVTFHVVMAHSDQLFWNREMNIEFEMQFLQCNKCVNYVPV